MKVSYCIICKNSFVKNSFSKVCSLKCRLLENSFVNEKYCWIWTGPTCGPYGKTRWKSKTILTHRASFEIFNKKIPLGKMVCHSCEVPLCINPFHLWIGTQKENIRDSVNKKRFAHPASEKVKKSLSLRMKGNKLGERNKGMNHPLKKLVDNDIYEIRRLLAKGVSQTNIAKIFNVDSSTISNIKRGRLWKHLI